MIAILCLDEWEYKQLAAEGRFADIAGTAIWSLIHIPRDRITDFITSPRFYQNREARAILAAVRASVRGGKQGWTLAWSGEGYKIDYHLGDDSYTITLLDADGPREIVLPRGHEEEEAARILRTRGAMRSAPPAWPRVVLRVVPGSLWARGADGDRDK
jgi:hypothetical protein